MNRWEQFKSLIETLGRTAKSGQVLATEETISNRFRICEPCEYFNFPENGKPRCDKCGCKLRYKFVVAESKCPLGKW